MAHETNTPRGLAPLEREVAARVVEQLCAMGLEARVEEGVPVHAGMARKVRVDALLQLGKGERAKRFVLEVKRRPGPDAVQRLQMGETVTGLPAMLVADTIPAVVAAKVREAGFGWADAAGNAHVDVPGMFVLVEGRKPPRKRATEKPLRAFQPAGLRLLFTLLCAPDRVDWPTRELAAATGIANGAVGYVLGDLERLGYLVRRPKRHLRLDRNLLDRWVDGYQATLRPKLMEGVFEGPLDNWWQDLPELRNGECLLGGEPAADELTHYLKPGTATFYMCPADEKYRTANRRAMNGLIAKGKLRTEPKGNIEFLVRFWPGELEAERPGLVPAVLVYADLVINGDDRCLETAEIVYEKYLAERFPTH